MSRCPCLRSTAQRLPFARFNSVITSGRYNGAMSEVTSTNQRPSWLVDEYRKAPRRPIELAVSISGPRTEPVSMQLIDISPLGCRVSGPLNARMGTFVGIDVADFSSFGAWVVWHRAQEFGLDFAHPLPAAVVDHLLGLKRQDGR